MQYILKDVIITLLSSHKNYLNKSIKSLNNLINLPNTMQFLIIWLQKKKKNARNKILDSMANRKKNFNTQYEKKVGEESFLIYILRNIK